MFPFAQLHLVEFIVEISVLLGYKNHRHERGQFVKLPTTVRTEPNMSVMKLPR